MYNQDGEHQESLSQLENSLDSSIIRLQHQWSLRNIDKGYKNTLLIYLNQLKPNQAKKYILKQQKKLEQNNYRGQYFEQMRVERQQILLKLYQNLDSQQNINEACLSLDELRKINLRICQSMIDFKLQLGEFEQSLFALSEGYGQFLRRLNKDNGPIINSYLKQYICFTKNYDPFFLFPYQKFQIQGFPQNIHEAVLKLFKMNISYVYRLIKARKQINTFLQIKKTEQISLQIQNKTFQEVAQELENQQPIQKKSNRYKYTGQKKVRRNKFQTIGYEQNNQQQEYYNERFSKSLPQRHSKTIQIDYLKTSQIKRSKKFKLRQITQGQKKSSIRQKPQNFQAAEDEDINIFRKNMLARKQKRRIINLKQIQQDSQYNEDYSIKPIKKLSLDLKRKAKYFTKGNLQTSRKKQMDYQQISQSSSSQQVMEPRNMQASQARFTKNLKMNLNNRNFLKRPVKKQRIKLSPLRQLKSSEKQDQSTRFYPNKVNLDFQNQLGQHKKKKQYYPLSPVIKQMIKQSSQSSDETSNNKKKQSLYQQIKRDNNQQLPQIKGQFRIKKIPINQIIKPEDQSQRLCNQYLENTSLKINDQTNDKNFRDIHIRRPHQSQSQNKIIQNQYETRNNSMNLIITKNFEKSHLRFQTARNQKQSFSRLSSRNKDYKQQKIQQKQANNSRVKNQFTPIINVKKKVQQRILNQIQKELQQSKQKKKHIQMKPGQIKIADLYNFIEKQKINPFQRQEFEVGLWKQNINLKHSYLTKFYMNSQLAAFGISSPRCDGDYNILYWATTCSDSFTTFLFSKYVDYLQKFTTLSNIYINSPAYSYADFQKKGSMYIRKRKNFQRRQLPYIPFLSLQCSNISFQQSKSSQISIFYSEQIQEFSIQNSKTNTIIALCDSNNVLKINLPSKAKIYQQKLNISQINNILDGLQIDSYAISQKIQVNQCKLFVLKDNSPIKNNYFYVRDGFFVPKGIEIYSIQKQKIMRLQMMREDYYLFFGKNFQTIQSFLTNTRTKPNGQQRFFGFKMFSKQLYGRIKNSQFLHKGCYGNWDINFLWQDQLKGTVIKQMPSSDYMFGPDSFYVAIYKSDSLLFNFKVQSSDFFF